ncbi:hypothetical protein SAMN05444851_2742 [Aliiroseovarius sediminilitoris]|uniref:DUF1127 domain-containing protein n=1 Tax=Aliiroseovarius sediminilitoris TaxID=1173584 RepID=A0A1I0QNL2_9RHOB|nr:hypothetical protein [Aliiroseovarius sediminilitoris]SEW28991.1 hypothetical protein SAMN05444851_2742 [Aliiroseovarius sediminilitoris]
MATYSTDIKFDRHPVRARIASFFASIGQAIIIASESRSRMDQIKALEARSDDELAEMGLKRENIVQHVFRDLCYI